MSNLKEKLKKTEEELRSLDMFKKMLFRYLEGEVSYAQNKIKKIETYELEKKQILLNGYREFIGDLYDELIQEFRRVATILDENREFLAQRIINDNNTDFNYTNILDDKDISHEELVTKIHTKCLNLIENTIYIIENKNIDMKEKIKELATNIRRVKDTLETYNIDYNNIQ